MKTIQEDCFHLGVKALIISNDKRILLLERDHPVKKKYWDIPGGRLQKGETLKDTLIREVKEETGWAVQEIQPFAMVLSDIRIETPQQDVGLIFSIFLCKTATLFHPVLSEEHVNFGWFSPKETIQKLAHYPQEFIAKLSAID